MENIVELNSAKTPTRPQIENSFLTSGEKPPKVEACGLTREELREIVMEILG